jgi:hypothetical protein
LQGPFLDMEYPDDDDIRESNEIIAEPEVKKSKKRIFLRVVTLLVLLSWVCGATGLAALFTDRRQSQGEQSAALDVVDQYMRYMQVNNAKDAYNLLSLRQQQFISLNDLEAQLDGKNHVPYEGYQSIRVKQFKISSRFFSNVQILPGISAELICDVNYHGGLVGEITATLEKQDGEWKLSGIRIIAPPDKFRNVLRA